MQQVLNEIADQHKFVITDSEALSGGDINTVILLKTSVGSLVIKMNSKDEFPGMFEAEANGLTHLRSSNTFRIPEVIGLGAIHNSAYLLLEYIPPGSRKENFWVVFADNLSQLHQNTASKFGLDRDNYIGSLPQFNNRCRSSSEFYISQRLEPQFRLARKRGFIFHDLDKFFKNCSEVIPKESPALLHGDLWNGNYLISEDGQPALYDPAVAYGHREMDLAMMRLFGGFPDETFIKYHEIFPLFPGWEERIGLWQLYYLLVHLNLFGSGYLSRVRSAMAPYL